METGANEQTVKSTAFVRESTGLVRMMGTPTALIYNTMISGLLIGGAVTYLWGPFAFPKSNMPIGLFLTGVLGVPMIIAYAMLMSAMPRSGGDYVFQSRLVHPAVAVTLIGGGYIIWGCFWLAYGGFTTATIAVSPFAAVLGSEIHATWLTSFGTWVATPVGITVFSLIMIAVVFTILARGMRWFGRIQWFFWILTCISLLISSALLIKTDQPSFIATFNRFMTSQGAHQANYYTYIIQTAHKAGYAAGGGSTVGDTIGIAAIFWSAVAFTMWTVANSGEIKHANRFRAAGTGMLGALAINTTVTAVVAALLIRTVGFNFLGSAGYLYFNAPAAIAAMPAPPFYGILVSIVANNPVLVVLMAIGFIGVSIQAIFGLAWGYSRFWLAMAFDRFLPPSLADVSPRFHTPIKAMIAYFVGGAIWVVAYNLGPIAHFLLAVVLASIFVFMGTMLAAVFLPYRAPDIYRASPIPKFRIFNIPFISILGGLGFIVNVVMAWYYFTNPNLYVNSAPSMALVGGIFAVSLIYYFARRAWLVRKGYNPSITFMNVPPE